MICFPNAKINIGLNVLEKREDGYHNMESVFYPVTWCDALEAIQNKGNGDIKLVYPAIAVPGLPENNLCYKVYNLLSKKYKLPSVTVWLLKTIPMGAGLGGGSADAAFFLKLLNELFNLNLSWEELLLFASKIGSDCSFFIDNKPAHVSGKGDMISPIPLDLSKYYISVIHPQIHIDTANAYSLITPRKRAHSLKQLIPDTPIHEWKNVISNDFEKPIFKLHPLLAVIKAKLYDEGAVYASMTGSGSAIYGIFEKKPELVNVFADYKIWTSPLQKYV